MVPNGVIWRLVVQFLNCARCAFPSLETQGRNIRQLPMEKKNHLMMAPKIGGDFVEIVEFFERR